MKKKKKEKCKEKTKKWKELINERKNEKRMKWKESWKNKQNLQNLIETKKKKRIKNELSFPSSTSFVIIPLGIIMMNYSFLMKASGSST